MHVALERDGSLHPQPNQTRAGDRITCRVVQDMLFVVSTCCTGIPGNDQVGAVVLAVAESLSDFPE